MSAPTLPIALRPVVDSDLPIFFAQQLDAESHRLAAFISRDPSDRAVFDAHWARIRQDPGGMIRTIVAAGAVAGNIVSFQFQGDLNVGYWIGKEFWGRGIATAALRAFLLEQPARPLHAGVAKDNYGSIRVLEKCGFKLSGYERSYAAARKQEIDEALFLLA